MISKIIEFIIIFMKQTTFKKILFSILDIISVNGMCEYPDFQNVETGDEILKDFQKEIRQKKEAMSRMEQGIHNIQVTIPVLKEAVNDNIIRIDNTMSDNGMFSTGIIGNLGWHAEQIDKLEKEITFLDKKLISLKSDLKEKREVLVDYINVEKEISAKIEDLQKRSKKN